MDKVALRKSHLGRGVYACRQIAAGETILTFSGPRVTRDHLPMPHGPENDYYLQIDDDLFLGPSGELDDYVNHSCDPNAGIRTCEGALYLVAIRPIPAGQEVCFDYSTVMDGYPWQMACACHSPTCRGSIGDFLLLPPEIQDHYVRLGVVPEFILKKHAEQERRYCPEGNRPVRSPFGD